MSSTNEDTVEDYREQKRFLRRLGRACNKPIDEFKSIGGIHVSHGEKTSDIIDQLAPLAERSKTAKNLLASVLSAARGHQAVAEGDIRTAATAFGYAYRRNCQFVGWPFSQIPHVVPIFQELAYRRDEDLSLRADAFLILAFLYFTNGRIQDAFIAIHSAQHLLPQDGALHACEGSMHPGEKEKPAALSAFTRAAELGFDNIDITLYSRAILTDDDAQACAWLEEYVQRAELDAWKVPRACYRLVLLYGKQGPRQLGAARRYYELGLQADKARLSFIPDEAFGLRQMAIELVGKYRACGNPACNVIGIHACAKCETTQYCSRDCQAQDWKRHKPECKRIQATK